jgi:hypothetical protein
MAQSTVSLSVQEHREAVRLAWKSRHIPMGSMMIGTSLVGSLLPTILTILAQSPVNPMP